MNPKNTAKAWVGTGIGLAGYNFVDDLTTLIVWGLGYVDMVPPEKVQIAMSNLIFGLCVWVGIYKVSNSEGGAA